MMHCPSPDSSTHQKSSTQVRKDEIQSVKVKKLKHSLYSSPVEGKKLSNDIQNHVINSTQDLEEATEPPTKRKRRQIRSKLKSKLKQLKLTDYNPILELNEIEKELDKWKKETTVLCPQSLLDHVNDRKLLGKELFRLITKKEFKKLLPGNLKAYDARDVKGWCLEELNIMSEQKLLNILKGDIQSNTLVETRTSCEQLVSERIGDLWYFETEAESSLRMKTADSENKSTSKDESTSKDGTCKDKSASQGQSDQDVFQEIIKIPDQNDIDELVNVEVFPAPDENQEELDREEESEEDTNGESIKGIVDDDLEEKNLLMLELEMRARALKSFIRAQEVKKEKQGK